MNATNPPSKSPKVETKAAHTTAVATQLIEKETTARQAKTERLRAARLAKEQEAVS